MLISVPPIGPTKLLTCHIFQFFKIKRKHFLFSLYLLFHIFVDKSLKEGHSLVYCILRFFIKSNLIQLKLYEVHFLLLLTPSRSLFEYINRSFNQPNYSFKSGRIFGSDVCPTFLYDNINQLYITFVHFSNEISNKTLNELSTNTVVIIQKTYYSCIIFQSLKTLTIAQLQHLFLIICLCINFKVFLCDYLQNRSDKSIAHRIVQGSQQSYICS